MAKRYYWLKLPEDFFRQKPIKKLRKIAGGDTYTVIYLKMLLVAIKQDGKLYFDGVEDDFYEELALELDEETENVKVTVQFLLVQGLMELIDEAQYLLPAANEMVGSESAGAQRMRKLRERKASQCDKLVTDGDKLLQIGDGEIEKDKREELDTREENREELEEDIHMSDPHGSAPKRKRVNYQAVIDLYNTICVDLPQVMQLNENRKKKIASRLKSFSMEQLETAFRKAQESDFMTGRAGDWQASFDWLIKSDSNLTKVLEGNYDNRFSASQNNRSMTTGQYMEQTAGWYNHD